MSNKKQKSSKILTNNIKSTTLTEGGSTRLISIFLDVRYTTVSKWNGNTTQPSKDNMDAVGELLEKDFRDLWEPQGRVGTGLAQAANTELERLNKEEKIPYVVEMTDKKTGNNTVVNNPILVRKIRDFVADYKKKNK